MTQVRHPMPIVILNDACAARQWRERCEEVLNCEWATHGVVLKQVKLAAQMTKQTGLVAPRSWPLNLKPRRCSQWHTMPLKSSWDINGYSSHRLEGRLACAPPSQLAFTPALLQRQECKRGIGNTTRGHEMWIVSIAVPCLVVLPHLCFSTTPGGAVAPMQRGGGTVDSPRALGLCVFLYSPLEPNEESISPISPLFLLGGLELPSSWPASSHDPTPVSVVLSAHILPFVGGSLFAFDSSFVPLALWFTVLIVSSFSDEALDNTLTSAQVEPAPSLTPPMLYLRALAPKVSGHSSAVL
ncbi:hypothetical protein Hypma_010420 [Hypsizygus marmoreus]|uniref:Uncharacterized protein n=1 Tax=Hypsizygus marmoreus TaxID=39966 RepID=A0A369JSU2_HYPMA|nr:hypothetical protein Hypma_010420 [Hypsizygus marmoreus]